MQTILTRLQSALDKMLAALATKLPDLFLALVMLSIFLLLAVGVPRLLRRSLRRISSGDGPLNKRENNGSAPAS